MTLFLFAILLPPETNFQVGTFVLSAQRLLMLASLIPCVALLLCGSAGSLRWCDILIFVHAGWIATSFVANHGLDQGVKSGGIYSVEVLSSYLLARLFIRNSSEFQAFVRLACSAAIVVLPFALIESISGYHVIREFFGSVVGSRSADYPRDVRLGLTRVCGPFQHPILFGMFCSTLFALSRCLVRPATSRMGPYVRTSAILTNSFMSLSSAAQFSIAVQFGLLLWNRWTATVKRRWLILGLVVTFAYITVDLLSNRDPLAVIISYLTLNPATGYTRRLTWEYGTAEVWRHPLIGIGFNDWTRPEWMVSASIDNLFLVIAVRHGLPGVLSFLGAVATAVVGVARVRSSSEDFNRCRVSWIVAMSGILLAACTVHLWGSALTFCAFVTGSGIWMSASRSEAHSWEKQPT